MFQRLAAEEVDHLRKLETQIKTLQGQLEKDGLTMSDSDRRAKETELGRQTREFQRLQREFREDLNLRRNEELAALFERANRVIKQVAESELDSAKRRLKEATEAAVKSAPFGSDVVLAAIKHAEEAATKRDRAVNS